MCNFIHEGRKTPYVRNLREPELKIVTDEENEKLNKLFEEIIGKEPEKRNIILPAFPQLQHR